MNEELAPRWNELVKAKYEFLKVLRLPLDYFMPPSEELPLPLVNNREAALLDDFRKLPIRTQDAFATLLGALARA